MVYSHLQQCCGNIEPCCVQPVVPGMLSNYLIGTGMPFDQSIASGMLECSASGSLWIQVNN